MSFHCRIETHVYTLKQHDNFTHTRTHSLRFTIHPVECRFLKAKLPIYDAIKSDYNTVIRQKFSIPNIRVHSLAYEEM